MHRHKNAIFAAIILSFLAVQVFISLNYFSRHETMQERSRDVYESIVALQNAIGYVGLIHHFKNYVLRRDEIYREQTLQAHEEATAMRAHLESLSVEVLGTAITLSATREMLDAYRDRLAKVAEMHAQSMPVTTIDSLVIYDDQPAHREIEDVALLMKSRLDETRDAALSNSIVLLLIVSGVLGITFLAFFRYFSREQTAALARSESLNGQLNAQQQDLRESEASLRRLLEDVNLERRRIKMLNTQLEQKNREMEHFIYTVSHDLKSPLVTISGFAKSIERELQAQLTEKQARRFSRIHANVKSMEELLDDLLNISRIVHQDVEKELVNTDALLGDLLAAMEGEINAVEGRVEIEGELDMLFANTKLLKQALQNLISNALRYRHPDRQPIVSVSTSQSSDGVAIHVTDNGIGIEEKYQERVFRIFERISDEVEGTGIGLTIVKTIAERLGGRVVLQSKEGEGSRFSLFFPNNNAVGGN